MSRYNTCIMLTIFLFLFTQSCLSLTQGASEIWMSSYSSNRGAKEYDETFTREIRILRKVMSISLFIPRHCFCLSLVSYDSDLDLQIEPSITHGKIREIVLLLIKMFLFFQALARRQEKRNLWKMQQRQAERLRKKRLLSQ